MIFLKMKILYVLSFSEGMTIYNKNMKPDKQQIESFKYNHSFFTALKYIQKELDISF